MPIWYTFYTFICLREQIFKKSIAREASFQEALALAERREVEKKGSILPLPHQAYSYPLIPNEKDTTLRLLRLLTTYTELDLVVCQSVIPSVIDIT